MRAIIAAALTVCCAVPTWADETATDAYARGVTDWRTLQAWFGSQTGDRAAGVNYWAANRNVPDHLSCADAASNYKMFGDQAMFAAGCQEAKRRLDPIDDRRHSDPQYRSGFADEAKRLPLVAGGTPPTQPKEPALCSQARAGEFCRPDTPPSKSSTLADSTSPAPANKSATPEVTKPTPSPVSATSGAHSDAGECTDRHQQRAAEVEAAQSRFEEARRIRLTPPPFVPPYGSVKSAAQVASEDARIFAAEQDIRRLANEGEEEQRCFDAVAKRREEQRAAEIARRQAEEQQQKEAAARQAAEQTRAADAVAGYKALSFDDLQLDGKKLADEETKVAMGGVYAKDGPTERLYPSLTAYYASRDEIDRGVPVLTEDASREFRQSLLHCTFPQACAVHVRAKVTWCTLTNAFGVTRQTPCLAADEGNTTSGR